VFTRAFYGGILQGRVSQVQARNYAEKYRGKTDVNAPYRRSTLLNLFLEAKALRMTDPRDRLFGIVGIARDIDEGDIRVNYSISAAQAFCQIFELFIGKYDSLAFLCFQPEHSQGSKSDDPWLPSWIPSGREIEIGEIMASKTAGKTTSIEASVNSEPCRLSVTGIKIDELDVVFNREPLDEKPISQWLPRLEEICRKLWPDANDSDPLYERQEIIDLFFPHLLPDRYRATHRLEPPNRDQKLATLRRVVYVAKSDSDKSTSDPDESPSVFNIVWGRFEKARAAVSGDDYGHCQAMNSCLRHSIFVVTKGGRMGTMHLNSIPTTGDEVWIIFGCPIPLVLRPHENGGGLYSLIGRILVPLLSDGDACSALGTKGVERHKIQLI
jgi:hypothetical protein